MTSPIRWQKYHWFQPDIPWKSVLYQRLARFIAFSTLTMSRKLAYRLRATLTEFEYDRYTWELNPCLRAIQLVWMELCRFIGSPYEDFKEDKINVLGTYEAISRSTRYTSDERHCVCPTRSTFANLFRICEFLSSISLRTKLRWYTVDIYLLFQHVWKIIIEEYCYF